jgi:hypothetical protein
MVFIQEAGFRAIDACAALDKKKRLPEAVLDTISSL